MMINFDKYVDSYDEILKQDLIFFEKDGYFAEYKVKIAREICAVDPEKILDYGCGTGRNIKYLLEYFPKSKIYGCDISKKSIEYASAKYPLATFLSCDECSTDNKYGLIIVSCVLHHVPILERNNVIKMIHDLMADDGSIIIFEHNPNNHITRYIVDKCLLDNDAILLKKKEVETLLSSNDCLITKRGYTLFFPRILGFLRGLEKYLRFIPLGGQYFIAAIKAQGQKKNNVY